MKLVVISDSHGSRSVIDDALKTESDAGITVHAGDGWDDIRDSEVIRLIRVPGNCDRHAGGERDVVFDAGGVRFLLTHGNAFGASYGTEKLISEAMRLGCGAVIFGHTHRAVIAESKGVTLINPGTASRSRSVDGRYGYAVIEAENGKIVFSELRYFSKK